MFKRSWFIFLTLLCLFSAGCTQAAAPSGGEQTAAAHYTGKIVSITGRHFAFGFPS